MFELLKNLPDQDAQSVLKRLRDDDDVETVLKHVKAGNLLAQMAVQPETRLRYRLPYREHMPVEYLPNNPYLKALIFEGTSLDLSNGQFMNIQVEVAKDSTDSGVMRHQCPYLRPFHAAKVIDPRLLVCRPSKWTSVCKDDALMRELLATFLCCEYQYTAAFQKDLFLADMIAGNHDFCSPLLVNILLGYACVRLIIPLYIQSDHDLDLSLSLLSQVRVLEPQHSGISFLVRSKTPLGVGRRRTLSHNHTGWNFVQCVLQPVRLGRSRTCL